MISEEREKGGQGAALFQTSTGKLFDPLHWIHVNFDKI